MKSHDEIINKYFLDDENIILKNDGEYYDLIVSSEKFINELASFRINQLNFKEDIPYDQSAIERIYEDFSIEIKELIKRRFYGYPNELNDMPKIKQESK